MIGQPDIQPEAEAAIDRHEVGAQGPRIGRKPADAGAVRNGEDMRTRDIGLDGDEGRPGEIRQGLAVGRERRGLLRDLEHQRMMSDLLGGGGQPVPLDIGL